MIPDSVKRQIKTHMGELNTPVTINAVRTSGTRSDTIHQFCEDLTDLGLDITCNTVDSDTDGLPSIELAANIRYAGVPSANEVSPFLAMLTGSVTPARLEPGTAERLNTVTLPAVMEIYVAPFCPHCPKLVEQLYPLALANPNIDLRIIDAEMFNDRSASAGIKSVPTVIIDDLFRAAGQVDMEEVLVFLEGRHPSSLGAAAMESMLKEGHASKLSQMMASENEVFPALLKVLTHAKWPVRLGAMVALEELADLNRQLADEVIDALWAQFEQVSDQVKGDIIYITGEIGGPRSFERITGIKSGRHAPEVCEAAIDALQSLQDRKSAGDQ